MHRAEKYGVPRIARGAEAAPVKAHVRLVMRDARQGDRGKHDGFVATQTPAYGADEVFFTAQAGAAGGHGFHGHAWQGEVGTVPADERVDGMAVLHEDTGKVGQVDFRATPAPAQGVGDNDNGRFHGLMPKPMMRGGLMTDRMTT